MTRCRSSTNSRKDKRIRLVGINYKDQPDNARRFIGRYGNPFAAVGADPNGRAAIEWGVYGVPETFLVGRDGRIAYKLVGPITEENLKSRGDAGDRKGAGGESQLKPAAFNRRSRPRKFSSSPRPD